MSIFRKTFIFGSWKGWDHQIHLSVLAFKNSFGVYPNIFVANSVTFSRMDIVANKNNIQGSEGKAVGKYETVILSGFSSEDYELEFCLDSKLSDKTYFLIFDSDPSDGGEPVPEEDTCMEVRLASLN